MPDYITNIIVNIIGKTGLKGIIEARAYVIDCYVFDLNWLRVIVSKVNNIRSKLNWLKCDAISEYSTKY